MEPPSSRYASEICATTRSAKALAVRSDAPDSVR